MTCYIFQKLSHPRPGLKFQPRINSQGRVHKEQYGTHYRSIFDGNMSSPYDSDPWLVIIEGFRKRHPKLPLLHTEYDSLRHYFHREGYHRITDDKSITEYMKKFVDWGNKEYGTNFKLESNLLFLEQYYPEVPSDRMIEGRIRAMELRASQPDHEKWMKEDPVYRDQILEIRRERDSLSRVRCSKK